MFDYDTYQEEQKEYLKDNIHLYEYYNPHPDNKKVGDCVKRAITKVTGKEYKEVSLELNRHKKVTGAKVFNDYKNLYSYIDKVLNAKKISGLHNVKVGEFCKSFTKGKYLVTTRKHIIAVVDGKIYDTWNSLFKAICRVYKISD